MFALGTKAGKIRLFSHNTLVDNSSTHAMTEIVSSDECHEAAVHGLAFNDLLRIYCSCSADHMTSANCP